MEKKTVITPEQLNNVPKDVLITMYLQLNDTLKSLTAQLEILTKQNASLEEKLAVLTQQRYGRKTEKTATFDGRQLVIDPDTMLILNEAEYTLESCIPVEPDMEEVLVRRKRQKSKGKREADLKHVETQIDLHTLSDEKLNELFPGGYDCLPDEVYYDLEYIPSKFVKHEHHVAVYAGKHGEGIVRADRPERLLQNSILTPALAAALFNAKYVNAVPLNRLSEEFRRQDVNISRQTMAGWMIRIAERYLEIVYSAMKKKLLTAKLVHCDETPFKLVGAGKSPGSKSYMCYVLSF